MCYLHAGSRCQSSRSPGHHQINYEVEWLRIRGAETIRTAANGNHATEVYIRGLLAITDIKFTGWTGWSTTI